MTKITILFKNRSRFIEKNVPGSDETGYDF